MVMQVKNSRSGIVTLYVNERGDASISPDLSYVLQIMRCERHRHRVGEVIGSVRK